ncbi:MAG TPA: protein-disulfide reductase DsbD [Arenimonas sp.]|uniref:protein-disulfide reductase DsbD family protein n=1 Tax=Arenimonas sp. TaxID=1872635 RepID=UPI002CDCBD58|nr:protein-disulfide reductase DsbD [Arenimonas sp.]HMB55782.1 protein-disulfide reductase DsbD [Arenimonas sp.]
MKYWQSAATILLLSLLAMVPHTAAAAVTEADLLPVDQAYQLQVKAVSRERVEFTWKIAPGYYLYRHRFAVLPVDAAFTANPLQLPQGHKKHDEFFGDVETYRDSVTAVLTGATAGDAQTVQFKVKYQGCADVGICYPPQTRVVSVTMPAASAEAAENKVAVMPAPAGGDALASLTGKSSALLNAGDALPEDQAFRAEAIANSSSEVLVRLTPAPGYYLYRDKTHFSLIGADGIALATPRWPAGKAHHDEHFGDVVVYFDQVEIPVPVTRSNTAAQTLTLQAQFQGCLTDGLCYPPMTRNLQVALPAGAGFVGAGTTTTAIATTANTAESSIGFLASLLLALLGGLILNLMPCVLPVLSFKALGLVQSGESRTHAKKHALWYTLGVLASFATIGALVLALRGAGQALGWGFQLQQPGMIATLTLLMFAIGLSLSGVWQFGAGLADTGQSLTEKSGATGDFFTGVLAVVVASPCTAPFMGSALSYAFTAPALPAMLVFLALGLGLALPLLLIGFVPALAALLPKPGAWMDTLKQWLAYPMYLTAVWLAWVFGKQRGTDALALLLVAMVVLALGLWWFERQRFAAGIAKKILAWLLLATAIGIGVAALRLPADARVAATEAGIVPYSEARLAQLRSEHKPVFIDMTADWCITCKVNEKAVLGTDAFKKLLADTGTVYMVGDWTNQDAEISRFLDQYKAPGVPLYVVFPADGGPGKKLPQVLSLGTMRDALTAAK